jgi:hypothetical protein
MGGGEEISLLCFHREAESFFFLNRCEVKTKREGR